MHFTELVRLEPYEEQGIYGERPVLVDGVLDNAFAPGIASTTSLELLDAVLNLLNDQVENRITGTYDTTLPSREIHRLYEAYTKLNFKLQLALSPLRFRDWHSFDRKFLEAQSNLDRRMIGQPELDWLDEPVKIVREAVESGWAVELYTSVDSGNRVGWPDVVVAMEALKRTYVAASGPDEYANVARNAKGVLEKLSDALWDTGHYQTPANVKDGSQRIKNRLETVIRSEFEGKEQVDLVTLMQAANEFSDAVRHRRNPGRYEATIAADSALFLANVLWMAFTRRKEG